MPSAPVFVTRKFPPSVGGMETLAAGVWRSIEQVRPDARLIAHGGANAALVWWLPLAVLRVAGLLLRRRADLVLTGDALTYAVLRPLLALARVPNATMIMGLDVTYSHPVYRAIVRPPLRAATTVLAISAATAEQAVAVGVDPDRVRVVRLGVEPPPSGGRSRELVRPEVRRRLGLGADTFLLITIGRLVPRKGVCWFTADVLPGLPGHVHYLVVGQGPDEEAIRDAAASAGVADRVHLLGRVSDAEREELLLGSDLFVQPNIAVPGDMEGFGLVVVEAAMRDTPVLAADLEGIKDAVVPGQTGLLVAPQDPVRWAAALAPLVADPAALALQGRAHGEQARSLYSEQQMGQALCAALGVEPALTPGHQ